MNKIQNRKSLFLGGCFFSLSGALVAETWVVNSQSEWEENTASQSQLELKGGMAIPTAKKATFL
ncbi:hypothetical protein OAI07_02040, partial [Akkermansiaceae bacterium]|nr:hypothetical protein [Akkermansiaceae bacterium]